MNAFHLDPEEPYMQASWSNILPLSADGNSALRVRLVTFKKAAKTRQILEFLDLNGCRPGNDVELSSYIQEYPDVLFQTGSLASVNRDTTWGPGFRFITILK